MKNIKLNNQNYNDVQKIKTQLQGSSSYAEFVDTSDANATSSDVLVGKTCYVNGEKVVGTKVESGEGTTINLQEKTVTDNGTYTADDGYDGLSKVTVNVEKGTTPTGTKDITANGTHDVTNYASVNVNVSTGGGSTGTSSFGESLQVIAPYLRTAQSLFNQAFKDGGDITEIPDLSFDIANNLGDFVWLSTDIVKVGMINAPNNTSLSRTFAGTNITEAGLTNTNKVNMFYQTFNGCKNLVTINGVLDFSACTNASQCFNNCTALETVRFVENTIGLALDFSSCKALTHDSLLSILNGLKTVDTQLTLTLGDTNLAKLTDEEKAIATNKNWALA